MRYFAIIATLLMFVGCSKRETADEAGQSPVQPSTPASQLPPPAPALAGTAWKVVSIDSTDVAVDSKSSLEFLEGGKVSGQGGCNRFGGPVEIGGSTLRFGSLMATKMACDAMEQEVRYFRALEAVHSYRLEGDLLILLDDKGADRVRLGKESAGESTAASAGVVK